MQQTLASSAALTGERKQRGGREEVGLRGLVPGDPAMAGLLLPILGRVTGS
ncbi:hypothetical protein ACFY3M_32345 [Streptomyces mirabilis]|uniref:hypothetical protein n=1 Tax=Streptomyces mirabilis TaxID=68239 RepID=UPI003680448E